MTGYQEGMFNAQMSGQTAQVLTNMYQNIDRDSKKAKVAQKNISHAIKDYQKFIEAKRKKAEEEANKRDGWSSLIVDGGFLLLGAAVTILTSGVAIPALFTVGSILDGVKVYEDFDKGRTGKETGTNIIKGFMRYAGLSKNTTDSLYNVVSLATGVAGSSSVFKQMAQDGIFITKGAKVTSLFENSKAVITGGADQTLGTGLKADFKVMGSNVKSVVHGNLFKEGLIPHISEDKKVQSALIQDFRTGKIKEVKSVRVQPYVKPLVKAYGKETVKQVVVNHVKDNVITPAIDNTVDKFMDKRSVGSKAIKHYLTNKLKKWTSEDVDGISKVNEEKNGGVIEWN